MDGSLFRSLGTSLSSQSRWPLFIRDRTPLLDGESHPIAHQTRWGAWVRVWSDRFTALEKRGDRKKNDHARREQKPKAPLDARIAALSSALDADKGARARAVHLVIVEQTLVQGVRNGLDAVPAGVLELAIPQLASLSLFKSSSELQRLLQCMHRLIEASSPPPPERPSEESTRVRAAAGTPQREGGIRAREPAAAAASAGLPDGSRPPPPGEIASDDDFQDTQASDDMEEIELPLFPCDQGTASGPGCFCR